MKHSKFYSYYLPCFLFCFLLSFFFQTLHPLYVKAELPSLLVLKESSHELKIGESFSLTGFSSTGETPKFKSSSSSIASVSSYGLVTGKKAGTALIIGRIKGAEAYCVITVIPTSLSLNRASVSLENGSTFQLLSTVSTKAPVTYRTSRRSIATVSSLGLIQALKPGVAVITASCQGASASVMVTVCHPTIAILTPTLTLSQDQQLSLKVTTSSGKKPTYHSSRTSVVTVDCNGCLTGRKPGSALIRVSLDGTTEFCCVTVTKKKRALWAL